jgi:putative SOS response-associated peptidase YedK
MSALGSNADIRSKRIFPAIRSRIKTQRQENWSKRLAAPTIAGLWDEWKNPETGEPLKSCTMIITEPNQFVAEVHDRMPVLLTEDQFDLWLSGDAGIEYLKPAPDDFLQKWPVSKRVNSSRADDNDPTLIEKVELLAA